MHEWEHPQLRHEKIVSLMSRFCSEGPLLDIGCGNGHLTRQIMDCLGLDKATGVDNYPLDKGDLVEGLTLLQVDLEVERIPLRARDFKIVHCGETLEHIKNTDLLLNEIFRMMAEDGLGFITTPNLASWSSRFALLLGYQPYCTAVSCRYETAGKLGISGGFHGQWGHIRSFTLRALKSLLESVGFEIIHMEGWPIGKLDIHLSKGLVSRTVGMTDSLLSHSPSLASRLAVVFKKKGGR